MKIIMFRLGVLFFLLLVDNSAGFLLNSLNRQPFSKGSRPSSYCKIGIRPRWQKRRIRRLQALTEHDEDVDDTARLSNPSRLVKRGATAKRSSPQMRGNTNNQPKISKGNSNYNRNRPNPSNNNSNDVNRKLNQALVGAESASAVLQLLQQNAKLQHVAAGNTLNSVNFSTALHRLARHAVGTNYKQDRAVTLADPRTALLLASIAEAHAENLDFFQSRELSNIGWALAKLKLPPPATAMPLLDTTTVAAEDLLQTSRGQLAASAAVVRNAVVQVATERTQGNNAAATANRWIPALSQLAGHILDAIGATVIASSSSTIRTLAVSSPEQKADSGLALTKGSLHEPDCHTRRRSMGHRDRVVSHPSRRP